jgi:hypothetical protein
MTTEDKQDRQRRLARERKRNQRQREREHKRAVGAKEFRFEIYRGTAEALARIAQQGQFEEHAEVLTLLIHGADELAQRDPSQFKKLISVTGYANTDRGQQ